MEPCHLQSLLVSLKAVDSIFVAFSAVGFGCLVSRSVLLRQLMEKQSQFSTISE